MTRKPRIVGLGLAFSLLVSFVPRAQASGSADEAAGLSLFEEAKRLAGSKQWEQACPKFAEANRLYPRAGILLSLGDCYEHANKLASAWGAFKSAEVLARNTNDSTRQEEATRRASAIEPGLAKVTIVAPANPPSGLTIQWDATVVGEGRWGTATPVDAGSHLVEVAAPGWHPWSTMVQIPLAPGNTDVRIPQLTANGGDGSGSVSSSTTRRTVGIVLGGASLVGVGIGSVFGGIAIEKNNNSLKNCMTSSPGVCSPQGSAARSDAYATATASTAAFVAGSVLLAGGIVVYFTGSSSGSSSKTTGLTNIELRPAVGSGVGTLNLRGQW